MIVKTCNKCGSEYPEGLNSCPNCFKKQQKRIRYFFTFLILLISVLIIFLINTLFKEEKLTQPESIISNTKTNNLTTKVIDSLLGGLKIKYDDMEEITWYYSKNFPKDEFQKVMYLYIGKNKNNNIWLRWKINYIGEDWLFIQQYKIKSDTSMFTLNPSYYDIRREVLYRDVFESYDTYVDDYKLEILKNIVNSKNVKIRYIGSDYYDERNLTFNEKEALKEVLQAYLKLKNYTSD